MQAYRVVLEGCDPIVVVAGDMYGALKEALSWANRTDEDGADPQEDTLGMEDIDSVERVGDFFGGWPAKDQSAP